MQGRKREAWQNCAHSADTLQHVCTDCMCVCVRLSVKKSLPPQHQTSSSTFQGKNQWPVVTNGHL